MAVLVQLAAVPSQPSVAERIVACPLSIFLNSLKGLTPRPNRQINLSNRLLVMPALKQFNATCEAKITIYIMVLTLECSIDFKA